MTNQEIQNIYDYSKSKLDIIKKLNINIHQNGFNIDKDILYYFSNIGINNREDISKKNLSNHWLEIQKRDYNLNPKFCEYCGKILPFEKRNSKCCNQSCGTALGNKKKGHRTEETKRKISQSLYKGIHIHKNICKWCGKEFETIKNTKYCSNECKQKSISQQISLLRQKEIQNGTFKGWQTRNIISYAEKFWIKVLDNNFIKYRKEYYFDNKYFLDFYIEINNRKIDLEIDGKQHKYSERIEHDKIRDEYIKSKGIEVYRIEWNEIKSNKGKLLMKDKINKFIKYLGV